MPDVEAIDGVDVDAAVEGVGAAAAVVAGVGVGWASLCACSSSAYPGGRAPDAASMAVIWAL